MGSDRIIAHLVPLMAATEFYHNFSAAQIVRMFYTPINLGQFQVMVQNGRMVAWCSWAFMNDETKGKFMSADYRVQPHEWNNGTNLVFMDFMAPYGHTREFYRQLKPNFDHFNEATWLRRPKGNRKVEVHNGR